MIKTDAQLFKKKDFNLKSKSDEIMLGNYVNQKLEIFVDSFNKYLERIVYQQLFATTLYIYT